MKIPTITLPNKQKMPIIGFGTYMTNITYTYNAVLHALKTGYRLLDTAKWYRNEEIVGKAIIDSKVPRQELFITSKVESKSYQETMNDVYDTLYKMNLSYLDLVLIHWPTNDSIEAYHALEDLCTCGAIKSIGISNFNERECDVLLNYCRIKPVINQIETHIYLQQNKMSRYLKKKNIQHESWAPFAEGYMNIFKDKAVTLLAIKYRKTPAQIMLRYLIQQNIIVIPKSINYEHIEQNLNIFDFELTETDMKKLKQVDKKKQYSGWPINMKEETEYER